jgi:antitoxin (DNA-binding transcriptional repressor) of toxin-antitoxin stability system
VIAIMSRAALVLVALTVAGCGSSSVRSSTSASTPTSTVLHGKPQAIEPTAGDQGVAVNGSDPIGDPTAHAPSLAQVKNELRMQLIAVHANSGTYVNPLRFVTVWGRTDQGVDAAMPVGAPILAPCRVKILAIIPNWFAGQPLVYFELLDGPDAGRIQFVAEQITNIAPVGIVQKGQPIARFAPSGTNRPRPAIPKVRSRRPGGRCARGSTALALTRATAEPAVARS